MRCLLQVAIITLFLAVEVAEAQEDTTPKERLWSPATKTALIGSHSHDSYVINVRKDRMLTVRISWQREGDNRAEVKVSESPNYFKGEQVGFGSWTEGGRYWSGKTPKTGNYYIYVVGYPLAPGTRGVQYTLKVKVNSSE